MEFTTTNIDRRQCRRVVPMEVLVLGCPRTGTSSMREALGILGYSGVYHHAECITGNPRDCEMWEEAFQAKFEGKGSFGKEKWDQLLGHCMAVADLPCVAFAAELMEAYPDAKVILTNRSPESWHRSVLTTVWPLTNFFHLSRSPLALAFRYLVPHPRFFRVMDLETKYFLGPDIPINGQEKFLEQNEYVRSLARDGNRDFLEFECQEGWRPLCEFLRKDIPSEPFPKINDAESMLKKMDLVKSKLKKKFFQRMVQALGILGGVTTVWFFLLPQIWG